MIRKLVLLLLLFGPAFAGEQAHWGETGQLSSERHDRFLAGLSEVKIVVVRVRGMVCDFCARGIEKVFYRDQSVQKLDIDLAQGHVLIAYDKGKEIDFAEIRKKILANGQDATAIEVLER